MPLSSALPGHAPHGARNEQIAQQPPRLRRVSSLQPEDNKLVTLARAARARTGAPEGAALRDLDGRTYAGGTVALPSLVVSAVGVVVSMAVASGARGAEAVVVLTDGEVAPEDMDIVRDFAGSGVTVHRGTPAGLVGDTSST